ncbi:hypothetical protein, partial [Kocuria rhizophila]|uniref:hypothetical protein n=1 Tax=Kocuria rhizophila TaxID=72000 RepID=UPI001C92BEBC
GGGGWVDVEVDEEWEVVLVGRDVMVVFVGVGSGGEEGTRGGGRGGGGRGGGGGVWCGEGEVGVRVSEGG